MIDIIKNVLNYKDTILAVLFPYTIVNLAGSFIVIGYILLTIEEMKKSIKLKHIVLIPFYILVIIVFFPIVFLMFIVWFFDKVRVLHLISLFCTLIWVLFGSIGEIFNTDLISFDKGKKKPLSERLYERYVTQEYVKEGQSLREGLKEYFRTDLLKDIFRRYINGG